MRGGGPWGGRRRHWAMPEGTAHVGLAQNRVSWERRVWGRGPRSPRRAGPGHLHMGLRTLRGARKRAGAWGVTVSMTQDCVGQLGPAVSPGPRRPPCVHMHNLGDGATAGTSRAKREATHAIQGALSPGPKPSPEQVGSGPRGEQRSCREPGCDRGGTHGLGAAQQVPRILFHPKQGGHGGTGTPAGQGPRVQQRDPNASPGRAGLGTPRRPGGQKASSCHRPQPPFAQQELSWTSGAGAGPPPALGFGRPRPPRIPHPGLRRGRGGQGSVPPAPAPARGGLGAPRGRSRWPGREGLERLPSCWAWGPGPILSGSVACFLGGTVLRTAAWGSAGNRGAGRPVPSAARTAPLPGLAGLWGHVTKPPPAQLAACGEGSRAHPRFPSAAACSQGARTSEGP